MNAVVAIGGPPVMRAVNAYRALVPSAVWVLGLKTPRDPNDQLVRSLESLVEPLMEPYLAAEAQSQVATMSAQLAKILLPTRDADPNRAVKAVSVTLWKDVAAVLRLIAMLDSAHAVQPVELVLDDDNSALARAAVAWARARGLPSVTLPARPPVRRPRKPRADRTIVSGERTNLMYRALDVDDSLLVRLAAQGANDASGGDERVARRTAARTAVTQALGWAASDIVVVFEPAASDRDSALEPPNGRAASFGAIFDSFVLARANVPGLRLAVVGAPSIDGNILAAQAAATAGLAVSEFAYGEADYEVWTAAADIVVSIDSPRSIDAAGAGVPAINLWRPAGWYLGPPFAAEDGVIDVQPRFLGATLGALANDPALRAQIAMIAGDHLAVASATAESFRAIAGEFVKRRHQPAIISRKPRPDIVIVAPAYQHASAGLRALYRLCHFINLAGGDASIFPGTQLHPTWNTPRRDTDLTDKSIVVYPEIYFATLPAKRVVRWVLNEPGLLGGPKTYAADEMVFYYHQVYRAAAQAATDEILTDERELQIALVDPELFYNDRSRPRLYDCVFVYKGKAIYDRVQPREIRDAYVIDSGWPASRSETAALLRGCRRLYSFDAASSIVMEAIFCGASAYIVREDGEMDVVHWDTSEYARQYFDTSQVERFLRLIGERWG